MDQGIDEYFWCDKRKCKDSDWNCGNIHISLRGDPQVCLHNRAPQELQTFRSQSCYYPTPPSQLGIETVIGIYAYYHPSMNC